MSDLRKQKYRQYFTAGDVDGDGFLEREDLTGFAERYIASRGAPADSPEAQAVREMMDGFWVKVLAPLDQTGDGRVDQDELLRAFEEALGGTGIYPELIEPVADTYWHLADTNGDGKIDLQEFQQLFMAIGHGSEDHLAEVFGRLDTDASGGLARSEYHRALEEFFCSDDPNAPGNELFGPLPG